MGQYCVCKMIEFSATVLLLGAILLSSGIMIAEESRKNLIDYDFFFHTGLCDSVSSYRLVDTSNHSLQCLARTTLCEVVGTVSDHCLNR